MSNLKSNLDRYMELKGIRKYSHLLADIARELGIKGEAAYNFAKNEKSNFSKMLKGERPLKYEFIIPLEKIFGVSLARLSEEDAYKLPVEKENVPFDKGFRYYAYLDDPKLYKDEFDVLLAKDGKSILTQTDEFGKTFLDYVVEYRSVNGVRYLHDTYGIKLKWYYHQFQFREDSGITWIDFENSIAFARLVASMNDAELFNSIYDSYNMFYAVRSYDVDNCIFCDDDYLELILDNEVLFQSIFTEKKYEFDGLTSSAKKKKQIESITYHSVNPIINNCMKYALKHLDKYKQRAIAILKFGIDYNRKKTANLDLSCYYIGETEPGVLQNYEEKDYCELIIFADEKTNDEEVNELIYQLYKRYTYLLRNR